MQSKTTTNTEQQNWFNDELELKKMKYVMSLNIKSTTGATLT